MGIRRSIFLAASILVMMGGITWLALQPKEPVYQGRRLSGWLTDAWDGRDADTKRIAIDAIRKIGTNALPPLISMMQTRDSPLKLKIIRLAGKQTFFKYQVEQADLHLRAAYGCSILQAEAKPAIPALMELLPVYTLTVADYLVSIGPDGVLALVGSLTNTQPDVRWNVATSLAGIGIQRLSTNATPEQNAIADQEAMIAVPALIKLLKDKNDSVREQAAFSLGCFSSEAEIVIPALIAVLQDPNNSSTGSSSAAGAAEGLGKLHYQAEDAVPALLTALKNPSPKLQRAAADALKTIDPEAAAKAGVK
jgi:HEAT repeat protein